MGFPGYVIACSVYAAAGLCTASVFLCSKTLRSSSWAQVGALLVSFASAIPAVAVSAMEYYPEFHLSFQGLLFLAASFCHAPVWIYIALFHGGRLVTLVKPQFECTKKEADQARGVIRKQEVQQRTLNEIIDFAEAELGGSRIFARCDSSPRGTDGNLEFFLGWEKKKA